MPMIDLQYHSFEDAFKTGNFRVSLASGRSHESDPTGLSSLPGINQFSIINLPRLKSPISPLVSFSLKTKPTFILTPPFEKKKGPERRSPIRGRSRVRSPLNDDAARKAFQSPISPDRFIPKRKFEDFPSTHFRLNKDPSQLSPREKILRQRPPEDDPFMPVPGRFIGFPGKNPSRTWLYLRPQQPHLINDLCAVESNRASDFLRQISAGSIWGVGGTSAMPGDSLATLTVPQSLSVRRSIAPAYVARFLPKCTLKDEQNKHESRIALALDIDPTTRLFGTCSPCIDVPLSPIHVDYERLSPFIWRDGTWRKAEKEHCPKTVSTPEVVPSKPFRILDAPHLRDDFYCSILAYSISAGILAVGLAQSVYLWSEGFILDRTPFRDVHPANYVTSLSFSSDHCGRSILAVARHSGQLTLWSILEKKPRFDISHPNSLSCVVFKPTSSRRPSEGFFNTTVDAEDLVAGDEIGNIWYYSIEWPKVHNKYSWTGSITLLAKISAHTQQICGLAWSPDDKFLATGGNDNTCMLFELSEILPSPPPDEPSFLSAYSSRASSGNLSLSAFPCLIPSPNPSRLIGGPQLINRLLPSWIPFPPASSLNPIPLLSNIGCLIAGQGRTAIIPRNHQKYRLMHGAAVKAIAFAPWQPSLLATGGGSNDRSIHFFQARTGVSLATITVFAQVTSLIWSQTRHEVAATFGYAQPEHPFRIAVFAWPSCAQVAVIPWGLHGSSWDGHIPPNYDCGRALWAVSYPGRPPNCHLNVRGQDPGFARLPHASSESPGLSNSRHAYEERGRERERRERRQPIIRPKEKEGGMWCPGTMEEGCIIVASSDQTIKFHEVWSGKHKSIGSAGLFGGSDILQGIEGIERSGHEVIR
ncbi:hypothetical protein N7495_001511 [Penicillium taxi]|uniref:uncharacterized protein n=1 Tax=Penicillium taxi TaxID=168475 RepID=UPI0025458D09|nr:uncharacterized protein N7495_001511 [Penicillium taxi]KAJ5908829.1 hypothetical protein N7495_001511 [Penicillium taxi]